MFKSGKISAGLLMFRKKADLEVFLVHPGGPFFKNKDKGMWSIPKGEVEQGEELFEAAQREFREETGIDTEGAEFIELGSIKQKSGKTVYVWAFEKDWNGKIIVSETISTEWPNRSGRIIKHPEIDKGAFFDVEKTRQRIIPAQFELIERLIERL